VSTPLATPDELGVYLGTTIAEDDPRGILILQLAHDLCESVVSPVPALGKSVEIAVAVRAYNNATSAHQMSLGSAAVSFGAQNSSVGVGGLYLSKSDRATLRRLAGRTGAFAVDLLPASVPLDAAPSVVAVDPAGAGTGELVRIEGHGFLGTSAVTFGAAAALFVVVSDAVLHAVMPTGTAADVAVVVTNGSGASVAYTFSRG
jgi:hypothetical protein